MSVSILGISGSARARSYNGALLEAAKEELPTGAKLEILDISRLPMFNEDRETNPPSEVIEAKKTVRGADAILFATPEFNFSVPALLKNAIEWIDRPEEDNAWDGKPAAVMSASTAPRGGARAQLHLRQIMVDLNMHPLNSPQLYVGRAQEAFDSDMKLVDQRYRKTMNSLLESLVSWARRLKVG